MPRGPVRLPGIEHQGATRSAVASIGEDPRLTRYAPAVRDRERLVLDQVGADRDVGRWLAALEDSRGRTLRELDGVAPALVDRPPDGPLGTIGSLLYHIGLIEADWVANDILGLDDPDDLVALLPWPDRDDAGRLTVVTGESLDVHLARLAAIRAWVMDRLATLTAADLDRTRALPRYDVSPGWAIHHLLQHEAEHRSHIAWIRDTS